MANIVPKSSTWIVIIVGFVIVAVVAAIYGTNFTALFNRPLFMVGFIVGVVAMLATAGYWAASLKEEAYEFFSGRMVPYIIAFAFTACWTFGWSSQYKVDKEDKIQYDGKK